MKGLRDLPVDERPGFGALVNQVKGALEDLYEQQLLKVREAAIDQRLNAECIDVSLPGRTSYNFV